MALALNDTTITAAITLEPPALRRALWVMYAPSGRLLLAVILTSFASGRTPTSLHGWFCLARKIRGSGSGKASWETTDWKMNSQRRAQRRGGSASVFVFITTGDDEEQSAEKHHYTFSPSSSQPQHKHLNVTPPPF